MTLLLSAYERRRTLRIEHGDSRRNFALSYRAQEHRSESGPEVNPTYEVRSTTYDSTCGPAPGRSATRIHSLWLSLHQLP